MPQRAWYVYTLSEILDVPATSRSLLPAPAVPYVGTSASDPDPRSFSITLQNAPGSPVAYTNSILTYNWTPRFVDFQAGLSNAWDPPFLYEDRQNLFYVRTAQGTGPASSSQSFGLLAATPVPLSAATAFPPLAKLPATVFYQGQAINPTGSNHA